MHAGNHIESTAMQILETVFPSIMHQPNYFLSRSLSHIHTYIGSYIYGPNTNHLYAIFTIRMRFLLHTIKEIRRKVIQIYRIEKWLRRR